MSYALNCRFKTILPDVNDVDLISLCRKTSYNVFGLEIAANDAFKMNILKSGYQLIGQRSNRPERKPSVAVVEKIFQVRPEKVQDHSAAVEVSAEPVDARNPGSASNMAVDRSLVL